ncbi:MAG: nuclear transport factor 2 family protein [Marinoscillum sp.]
MKPKAVIETWISLFNEGSAKQLAELYHDDAINRQVANEPIHGKKAIHEMFAREFNTAKMTCIPEHIFEDGEWAIMEWKDPIGLRGCGFFQIIDGKIKFQRGYWDKLSFLRMHKLPIPKD